MTAKEKAIELIEFYKKHSYNGACEEDDKLMELYHAKRCALKVCEEIMNLETIHASGEQCFNHVKYWREVKKEIELL